jgi:signal transduction histidine kinase
MLAERRHSIVRRWIERVRSHLPTGRPLDEEEVEDSLHPFLDEVIAALEAKQPLPQTGSVVAQAHGAQREILDRDIADVVREYGLLFEAIVEECQASGAGPFDPEEYGRLAGCLSRGAAEAVREFAGLRALELRRQAWEHFAFLAHEIRGPLQTARMALHLHRSGSNPERSVQVLERSLAQLSQTVDQALIDARLRGIDAGAALHLEPVDLEALLQKAIEDSRPDAEARHLTLTFDAPQPVQIRADDRVLRAVFGNLVRNAVKFTRSGGKVSVRVRVGAVEIEDECGGLREGDEQKIFQVFRQSNEDRSGFGLGLAIARQGVEAHGGELTVRNLPGRGCVFTVRFASATPASGGDEPH